MPKPLRKAQRALHHPSLASQHADSAGPSRPWQRTEARNPDSQQPLFFGRNSEAPEPSALNRQDYDDDVDDDDDDESELDDPTELPSTKRRREASKRAAAALVGLGQRSRARHNPSAAAVLSEAKVQLRPEPRPAAVSVSSPTSALTHADRSTASPSAVKAKPEIIEIKSDDDDVQIIECPAPPLTPPPPPEKRKRRTPAARRTAEPDQAQSSASVPPTSSATLVPPEKRLLKRDAPWPEHLLRLEQAFKAVNTVYSFCSARKHMVTTFDTIRSTVEGLIKRPLEIFDIAQIKSLCGDLVNFAYIEQEMLEVHMDARANGGEPTSASKKKTWRGSRIDEVYRRAAEAVEEGQAIGGGVGGAHHPSRIAGTTTSDPINFDAMGGGFQDVAPEGDVYSSTPGPAFLPPADLEIAQHNRRNGKGKAQDSYVLLFEFNDGTLTTAKATSRGRPGMRRGPNRDDPGAKARRNPKLYSMPSTASMMKLIAKRNAKFEQAVLELLAACATKDEDPVQLLVDAAHDHVPLNPETAERTTGDTPQKKRIRLEFLMQNPDHRASIAEIIEEMQLAPWWKDQIVPGGHKTFEPREARYAPLHYRLSEAVVTAMYVTHGIEHFYTHQAQALNALHEGKSVIVSTSTSSGKSLIYQLPVLQALERDGDATAMYIFPTKALAQDQRRSLQDLLSNCEGLEGTIVATYDGDTESELRKDIRSRASVIFTNPDMLHQSILPSEDLWRRFLRKLRFVVVDELHTYNGLFGAHVSFIMRRLRRICCALGNEAIQFVSCSATVANPKEHMQTLFGVDEVEVITDDGSSAGKKEWLLWNPPLIDEADPAQGRVSSYAEVSKVFRHLVQHGVRTIVFTKVRRTCEIVMRQIRQDLLLEDRHDVAEKVMSYRSGYSPQDRRKIEQDMFQGRLLGIVATSALELGIDIGSLDAVIMLGFPYSISSLRQQAGRAGRRQKDSLAVLIADPWPLDQHYMRFPDEVFLQPDAALSVDLGNDFVLESHLQCAAEEMPVSVEDDERYFGPQLATLCQTRLQGDGTGYFFCREELRPNPARDVAIRGARQVTYAYVDDTPGRAARVMEEVEMDRAIFEAFEGAVFMHQGVSYICREISHDVRIARMVQVDVNYHTRPRDHTDTDAVETYRIRRLRGSPYLAYYGKVTIASYVWGYFKVDRRANILDAVEVDCPPFVRHTRGMWIDVPLWIVAALTEQGINAAAAIHAAEHALLSLTPMFVVSMAGDVKTECKIAEKEYATRPSARRRPARLIFYDAPGQNGGLCSKAFEHLDGLVRIAIAVIEACGCLEGCPSCVTSQTCAHANVVTSKVGALAVLRGIAGRELFDLDLEVQREQGVAERTLEQREALQATISEAVPVRVARKLGEVQVEDVQETLPPSLQAIADIAAAAAAAGDTVKGEMAGPRGLGGLGPGGGLLPGKSRLFQE
ncbi:ATP-dependent 3'-5' DNA helicase [Thecaphora frezii]